MDDDWIALIKLYWVCVRAVWKLFLLLWTGIMIL